MEDSGPGGDGRGDGGARSHIPATGQQHRPDRNTSILHRILFFLAIFAAVYSVIVNQGSYASLFNGVRLSTESLNNSDKMETCCTELSLLSC